MTCRFILPAVEGIILTDLKEEEQELRQEADAAKSQAMGNAAREAAVKAQDEAMRIKAREVELSKYPEEQLEYRFRYHERKGLLACAM